MSLSMWPYLAMVGLGAGVGFLSGFLGVGGGVLAVPVLVLLFHFSQHEAQGTSLAIIVVTALVAAAHYGRHHDVNIPAALAFGAGSVMLAGIGAATAQRMSEDMLRLAFAVFVGAVAASMVPRPELRLFSPVLGAVLVVMGARLLLR
jgi:hypothetical protein